MRTDHITMEAARRAHSILGMALPTGARTDPAFSFREMFESAVDGHLSTSIRDLLAAEAQRTGAIFDSYSPQVAWRHLHSAQRDLSVGGTGGHLVSTAVGDVIAALPPESLIRQLGVTVVPNMLANVTEPRVATDNIGYWLGTESAGIPGSDPALGGIAYSPKMAGATFKVSRLFIKQAPNADEWIRAQLSRAIDVALTKALLNGSGTNGEPLGIVSMPGIGTQSGASLSFVNTVSMVKKVRLANAGSNPSLAWVGDPATLEVLETRAKNGTGSGFIAADGKINGLRYHSNTALPTASAVVGAWSELVLAMWGAGPVIEITPWGSTSDFRLGQIVCRVMVPVDVAARHPAAFTVATAVT